MKRTKWCACLALALAVMLTGGEALAAMSFPGKVISAETAVISTQPRPWQISIPSVSFMAD